MLTPLIDIMLKFLIAVSVTQLVDWPVYSIFVFNFATLFSVTFYLHYNPYEDRMESLRVKFNGLAYLVLNYHLFLFTEYSNQKMFPLVAQSTISLIWFFICVNVLITVIGAINPAISFLKKIYLRSKYKKHARKARKTQKHTAREEEK